MKPAFILPLALVFALLIVVPVAADRPVVQVYEWTGNSEMTDPRSCAGIEVWDRSVGTTYETSYFDNQGNLRRILTHYTGTDNLYNPLNTGVELSGHFSVHVLYDARTGEETIWGHPYGITVPGYGTVAVVAGRMFPDGRFVGRNSFADPKDMEQLCSLLAGN
jgi:hypothetical protein